MYFIINGIPYKNVGIWLVNDLCIQNPCTQLVTTQHHDTRVFTLLYRSNSNNHKRFSSHPEKGGQNFWETKWKVPINTEKQQCSKLYLLYWWPCLPCVLHLLIHATWNFVFDVISNLTCFLRSGQVSCIQIFWKSFKFFLSS